MIKNNSGILNARYGIYDGKKYLFTHRNPSNGYWWSDNIPNEKGSPDGRWVSADKIKFIK